MGSSIPVAALALSGLGTMDLLMRSQQLSLANQQRKAEAKAQIAQIEADRETEERRRARALAAASATARARLGAGAGGTAGGSGEALLAGLIDESETETLDAFARRQRQIDAIRAGIAFDKRRNLLDQAQLVSSYIR